MLGAHVWSLLVMLVIHHQHTSPTSASHVGDPSPTSVSHVGDFLLASASHVGSMSPTTASHVGGIHMIENPRCLRCNPRFLCKTCEGIHLTHLCPFTVGIPEAWGSPKGPSDLEAFVVSPHPISPFIDTVVTLLQCSPDHTPVVEGDVSPIPVIMHPLQPRIEEVVVPMQALVNTNLLLEADASFNHVINIHDPAPSE